MDILTATKLLGGVFCLPFPIALASWAGHPSSDLDQEVSPSGSSALSPLSPPREPLRGSVEEGNAKIGTL